MGAWFREYRMSLAVLVDAVKGANINGVRLALKDRQLAREYVAQAVQRYDELMGFGLPAKNPLDFMYEQAWAVPAPSDRVELPVALQTAGGTRLDELLVLATVTRVLRPKKVFEIGTFMGRTTSVFILNAPDDAKVVSLDLPIDADVERNATSTYLPTDVDLVKQRRVGSFLSDLNLTNRYQQVLCDSLAFDPVPHRQSVELGFIDGAHTLRYVQNDTEKMATMMADRGLVFWHDYGGKGRFRELTEYLNRLSREISIYRAPNTTLAWAPGSELRKIAHRP
jgi:predicted O-methyltransferase YrrM